MATIYRKLYRSRGDRMIGGVCAGLGEYFQIDPTLIRLSFIVLGLAGFAGAVVVAYLVMLIVIPEEPLAVVATGGEAEAPEPIEGESSEVA